MLKYVAQQATILTTLGVAAALGGMRADDDAIPVEQLPTKVHEVI